MSEASGFNWGSTLDNLISVYGQREVAKVERDTAEYNAAAANQVKTLHPPVATNTVEAYNTGNIAPMSSGYYSRIPKELLWGSVALLGGVLVLKAITK